MTKSYIYRKYDILDPGVELNHLYTFMNFPVFMGCVSDPKHTDYMCDLSLYISPKTGIIQINPMVTPDIVYKQSHGSGTVGATWEKHHYEFSEFVKHYRIKNHGILELGSSHGYLMQHFTKIDSDKLDWTIVEPNYYGPKPEGLHLIRDYFTSELNIGRKFHNIVHSHVFEHIMDYDDFFKAIKAHMEPHGHMMFSIPNFDYLLKGGKYQMLNFEHTVLLREVYVDYLLRKNGFEICHKTDYGNHSIFYYVMNKGVALSMELDGKSLYEENFNSFYQTLNNQKADIVELLNVIPQKKNVFLFGGHIFSQFMLNMGLRHVHLSGILDNDTAKQGLRLYGSSLYVQNPLALARIENPSVIIRAGVYTNEIEKQLISINPNTEFL